MKRVLALLAALVLAWLAAVWAQPAGGERRVALVVGNGAYQHTSRLVNAPGDAAAIGEVLRKLGFAVEVVADQTRSGFEQALRGFARRAAGADIALFFYSGHGIQANGVNYLLPVDASPERAEELGIVAVDAAQVELLMRAARVRLLILDACRNNPFVSQLATRSRGVARGLARIEAAAGTLIAYATAEGQTADDGEGRNSPFTAALLRHLPTPGIELQQALTRVRQSVMGATSPQQVPWVSSSLNADVYLAGLPAGGGPQAARPAPVPEFDGWGEQLFWQSIQGSSNAADFEAYLRQFPNGWFAGIARHRIAALRLPAAPAAPPPTVAPHQ